MQTARFEIGSLVKMTGGLAEHYRGMTAEVIAITPNPQGLLHLCRYHVFISGFGEDTFYEFQLALEESNGRANSPPRLGGVPRSGGVVDP